MTAYLRELEHAKRDTIELRHLIGMSVQTAPDLTLLQLMQAIGLATMVRGALLRAAKARETEGDIA